MGKTTSTDISAVFDLDTAWYRSLQRAALRWFDRHARDLPWRRCRDPYAIWVSEVMLQQTQVATVIPYFERFLVRFPSVGELAAAEEQIVLRYWEGLGYYRRARQLHAAARTIVAQYGGQFPTRFEDVLALPGIGRYTAGAILSIARDARLPILEGNTIRVYSRLLGFQDDPRSPAGQRRLWDFAAAILPTRRAGAFNQAMMELGSEICHVRGPACDVCPVAAGCAARALGLQQQIPRVAKKVQYEDAHEAAVLVWKQDRVLLRRCGDDERWAGLWDFPRFAWPATGQNRQQLAVEVQRLTGIQAKVGAQLAEVKHAVTRFRITLRCFQAQFASGRLRTAEACRWVTPGELPDYPLSVTGRQLARLLDQPR